MEWDSYMNVVFVIKLGDTREIRQNHGKFEQRDHIVLAVNAGKTKYIEIGRHRGMIANAHIKIGDSENL